MKKLLEGFVSPITEILPGMLFRPSRYNLPFRLISVIDARPSTEAVEEAAGLKTWNGSGHRAAGIVELAHGNLTGLLSDKAFSTRLSVLGARANSLTSFVRGYAWADVPELDTDDEILNWVFEDVVDDLAAAIWNIAAGFNKVAGSTLRSALEMGAVALYFQRLENEAPASEGYNQAFSKWDRGDADTPSWGITKPILKRHPNVREFSSLHGYCVIERAHAHFKYLCSFTHGRAFSPEDGLGTNSMNLRNLVGEVDPEELDRLCLAFERTVAEVASMWAVTYPHIVTEWEEPVSGDSYVQLADLFTTPETRAALAFARMKRGA